MEGALQRAAPRRLQVGDVDLDLEKRSVRRGGRHVRIGPTEFRLLESLMEQPGRVWSRAELLRAVWGQAADVELRTVDAHVSRLRRALVRGRASDPIETLRGVGYSFVARPQASAGSAGQHCRRSASARE